MGWLESEIENAITDVLTDVRDGLLGLAEDLFQALLQPIIGVPAPESDSRYIVVNAPSNDPWNSIYQDFYLPYILPLAIMLLLVALAFIGLRAGSISEYRRKRLLRRIGIVFLGSFVWFPLVSIPLQFVNAVGMTLAPIEQMSSGFGQLTKAGLGGLIAVLVIAFVENILLLLAAFVYGLRWLGIIVLTPLMPLIGVLWAVDVWPLSSISNTARRTASIYPGLIIAGVPAAALFRLGWQTDPASGLSALFALILGLSLIPAACIASILTVYWSAPTLQRIAHSGTQTTARGAPKAKTAAKKGTGTSVRGARNVHRGYAQNAHGPVTKNGQTQLGSGDSNAYKLGSSAQSAKTHAGRYNDLWKSESGRMRDQAKADVTHATQTAKARSKQAFRKTKQKVSRW